MGSQHSVRSCNLPKKNREKNDVQSSDRKSMISVLFFKDFFDVDRYKKSLLNLLQYYFHFTFVLFCFVLLARGHVGS